MAARNLLDDLAQLVTDASGAAQGVRRELETIIRAQADRMLRDRDIPTREEVDVLRDIVTTLRHDNEALAARIAVLESGTH